MNALIWPGTEAGKCWAVVASLTMEEVCMMHPKKGMCLIILHHCLWHILHGIVTCTVLSSSASERIRTAGMWLDFPSGQCQYTTPRHYDLQSLLQAWIWICWYTLLISWVCPHTLYWSRQQPERKICISVSRLGCPAYWLETSYSELRYFAAFSVPPGKCWDRPWLLQFTPFPIHYSQYPTTWH
jgi:hypothetical protein